MPYDLRSSTAAALSRSRGMAASSTVCVNRGYSAARFESTVTKARGMVDAGAYLHWYQRYGCEKDQLLEAFEATETVCDNYRYLSACQPISHP